MPFGTVQVGRLTLTEALGPTSEKMDQTSGLRTVTISGQESAPPLALNVLHQRLQDVLAHPASVVPVTFTDKANRNGYYRVVDNGSDFLNMQQEVATADWQLELQRVGTEHEVDLESRLSGPQSRVNDFTITGERIHTPPIGAYAYSAGTTLPTSMTRASADGTIIVYRGIPLGVHPRWACPLANYLNGRARFIDTDGLERSGTDLATTATGWQVHNGLVRVRPVTTTIEVSTWDPELANWSAKAYNFQLNSSNLGAPNAVTILRNEPEIVVVRILWNLTIGRTTADLTIRRGHRLVEVWVETQTSATLKVVRASVEAGTSASGYLTATANDTDGNRYFLGSARTATQDTTNGGISLAATTTFGLAIGAVVGGSGAISGDAAADLFKQYIGAPSERVAGVRR
jgi:hypothetical protein